MKSGSAKYAGMFTEAKNRQSSVRYVKREANISKKGVPT